LHIELEGGNPLPPLGVLQEPLQSAICNLQSTIYNGNGGMVEYGNKGNLSERRLPPAAGNGQKDRRGREGVTLIELLMAVAILGVIATVVAMTLNVGVESWRTGTALADEAHHADAVMEQVVMALRSAYYPEAKDPTYEYGFTHEDGGEAPDAEDVIGWVKIGNSLIGEDVPWAGASHRVELFLKTDDSDEGPGLYVKAWQLVGQAEDFDPEEDVTALLISDQIVSFDCRMKDPDYKETVGEPYEWLDEWTASNRIPTHVMISIAVKPQKEKEEPLQYVRCVEMPMAAMSWNPMQTGSSTKTTTGAGGSGGATGGGGAGGGGTSGGGVNINRGSTGGSGRSGGGTGTRGTRDGTSRNGGFPQGGGRTRDGNSGRGTGGGGAGRPLEIRNIRGGK
jgi:prepilin-type N-terminal cleavage/methylation domain-containing protein